MTTQAVSGRRYFTKAWLMEQKSLIALLVLIAVVSTMSPNFFTVNNLFNILQQTSVNAIMAVGMTLVILTSGSICPSAPCWRSPVRWQRRSLALRLMRWWRSRLPSH
ncbi:ribose ABC transport system [Klebsiella pneumoniae]|uniref:Ribose ABC transport system n=1 Tax=Klebsiella pneumoniae TaxID=573 RepID=A0A377TJ94_KLEPN|nr:ribose ABC transport system [Klebsiella pneumoniae]STV54082.1 ribose ABC transport system [Klebsiella pneumoniae]